MNEKIREIILPYRWWWLGGLIAVAAATLLFFWLFFSKISPYRLISERSGLVLTIQNPGKFLEATHSVEFGDAIGKWVICSKFRSDLHNLDKLFKANPDITDNLQLTVALQSSDAQTLDFLYILQTPVRTDIRKIISKAGIPYRQDNFNGHTIFSAYWGTGVSFSFAEAGHLLIAARKTELVEDALSVMDSATGISENQHFDKIQQELSSQTSAGQIFLNVQALPAMLSSFLQPSGKKDLEDIVKKINWLGAGINVENDRIAVSGRIITSGGESHFSKLPEKGYYNQQRISAVLPSNTAAMFWLGAGDFREYYGKVGNDQTFGAYIAPWMGEEAACAVTEPLSAEANSEVFAIFRIKDSTAAKTSMKKLEKKRALLFENTYNGIDVRQFRNENILSSLTGRQFTLKDPFYSFIGDYAVFCSSRTALELCIDKYLAKETMASDVTYQQFVEQFDERSSLFLFLNLAKLEQQLKNAVLENMMGQLDEQLHGLKQMSLLGLQLYPLADGFRFSGKWQSSGKYDSHTSTSIAWKFLLDSEAIIPPAITLAEDLKSNEVFIQDRKNQIYIINSAGEIRMKKALDEPILSEIRQVDYNRSGRLYYLFNTAHKIHMLDSRGNEVLHFPIILQTPATTGMLVTDFEKGAAWYFFVPVQNGNVYGFENNGKPLAGWNPRTGVGLLRQPMRHFHASGKDYIIALASNQLVVLKKNGELHMNPIPIAGEFLSPPGFQSDENAQRIVVMNSNGMATNVNLEGTAFNLALGGPTSRQMRMCYEDVCGDGRNEFISLDENTITCRGYSDSEFKKFFEVKLTEKADDIFVVKMPGEERSYIGYVSKSSCRIYLIDGAGNPYRDFPLAGNTAFRVSEFFGDGVPSLVVANGSGVYIYKLR